MMTLFNHYLRTRNPIYLVLLFLIAIRAAFRAGSDS